MTGNYGGSPIEFLACEAMLRGKAILQFFTYSAAFLTGTNSALAASGTTEVGIQLNNDADFVCQRLAVTSTTAAGTFLAVPDYTILLVAQGSGKQLMNQAQMIANMAGSFNSNQFNQNLPFPLLLQKASTLSVQLVNRTATAANRADVALIGFKIYYTGKNNWDTVFSPMALAATSAAC